MNPGTAAIILSYLLFLSGSFFCFAAAVGLLRFPDFYTRLHAGTKSMTAGAVLILLGVGVLRGDGWDMLKLLAIVGFFLMTNPVATHAIARASYRQNIAMPEAESDEYRSYLEK